MLACALDVPHHEDVVFLPLPGQRQTQRVVPLLVDPSFQTDPTLLPSSLGAPKLQTDQTELRKDLKTSLEAILRMGPKSPRLPLVAHLIRMDLTPSWLLS